MPARILIVDSDVSAAQVTRAIVAHVIPNSIITIEPTSERARQQIQACTQDVVIIDPVRYSLAGIQLIEALKQVYPETRVMALVSAPTLALQNQMQRLGVDVYLEKPALLPVFAQKLQLLLPEEDIQLEGT